MSQNQEEKISDEEKIENLFREMKKLQSGKAPEDREILEDEDEEDEDEEDWDEEKTLGERIRDEGKSWFSTLQDFLPSLVVYTACSVIGFGLLQDYSWIFSRIPWLPYEGTDIVLWILSTVTGMASLLEFTDVRKLAVGSFENMLIGVYIYLLLSVGVYPQAGWMLGLLFLAAAALGHLLSTAGGTEFQNTRRVLAGFTLLACILIANGYW